MSKFRKICVLALTLTVMESVVACSLVKPVDLLNLLTPNTGFTLEPNIAYGVNKRQSYDLYNPVEIRSGSPILNFIYGGAWCQGEKSDYKFFGQAFAEEGYRVVIPNYRL